MRKLQSRGVHHITLVGADRQTSNGRRTRWARLIPIEAGEPENGQGNKP
jgi:hypothetical protein